MLWLWMMKISKIYYVSWCKNSRCENKDKGSRLWIGKKMDLQGSKWISFFKKSLILWKIYLNLQKNPDYFYFWIAIQNLGETMDLLFLVEQELVLVTYDKEFEQTLQCLWNFFTWSSMGRGSFKINSWKSFQYRTLMLIKWWWIHNPLP